MNAAELLADDENLLATARDRVAEGEPERPLVEELLVRYDEVDARLVAAGFPPTSPWWRATIERFAEFEACDASCRYDARQVRETTSRRTP